MTNRNQTSTRFKDEIRIIPPWVFFLAVLLVRMAVGLFGTVVGRDPHAPPLALRCLLGVVGGTVVGCYVVLIGYINPDAGRRRMSRVLWTLIAIFVPNGLGIVLYFVLRKPRTATVRNAMPRSSRDTASVPAAATACSPSVPTASAA